MHALQPDARPVAPGRSILAWFWRDRRGAYAVEFALLVMPFFALLCAIFEVCWVSFNAEQLQAAVDRAARAVMTGTVQSSDYPTPAAFVAGLLCPSNGKRIIPSTWDCSRMVVDVRTASNFGVADMSKSFYRGTTQYCLGKPSTIVVLRVAYPMQSVFPLSIYNPYVGLANDVPGHAGWFHILMGAAAFKTEAFTANSSSC